MLMWRLRDGDEEAEAEAEEDKVDGGLPGLKMPLPATFSTGANCWALFLRHSSWSLPPLGGAEAEQNSLSSAPSWYRSRALKGINLGASRVLVCLMDRREERCLELLFSSYEAHWGVSATCYAVVSIPKAPVMSLMSISSFIVSTRQHLDTHLDADCCSHSAIKIMAGAWFDSNPHLAATKAPCCAAACCHSALDWRAKEWW